MKKIYIDAGHGGKDAGAVGIGGLYEKTLNLTVATYLKGILKAKGFDVLMSRENDIFVEIDASAAKANSWGADVVISIHHNAGGGDGAEIIVSAFKEGTDIAERILPVFELVGQNLRSKPIITRINSTGRADYYGMIRLTNAPAMITEYAFIDTVDVEAVDTDDELYAEAAAIAHGLCNYYGVPWEQPKELTEVNDIVWELVNRGIVGDTDKWLKKLAEDQDAYWLARKMVRYIRGV